MLFFVCYNLHVCSLCKAIDTQDTFPLRPFFLYTILDLFDIFLTLRSLVIANCVCVLSNVPKFTCLCSFFVVNKKKNMPLWFNVDHRFLVLGAFGVNAGISLYLTCKLRSERSRRQLENVYESTKLVNEYLVFHFGSPSEILRYDFGPQNSLDFPKRCADLCIANFNEVGTVVWHYGQYGYLLFERPYSGLLPRC